MGTTGSVGFRRLKCEGKGPNAGRDYILKQCEVSVAFLVGPKIFAGECRWEYMVTAGSNPALSPILVATFGACGECKRNYMRSEGSRFESGTRLHGRGSSTGRASGVSLLIVAAGPVDCEEMKNARQDLQLHRDRKGSAHQGLDQRGTPGRSRQGATGQCRKITICVPLGGRHARRPLGHRRYGRQRDPDRHQPATI